VDFAARLTAASTSTAAVRGGYPHKMGLRSDGRVVDGGGLEKLIGAFDEFAIFLAKSARHAR